MKVFYTPEVVEFTERLSRQDYARLNRTRKLFERYGFQVGQKYIKKVAISGIWELRVGNIRLFLGIKGDRAIGVHIIHKKTQKLPIKDIKLAEKRFRKL